MIRDDIASILAVKYGDSPPARRGVGVGVAMAAPDPPKVAAARARWQGRWSVLRGRRDADNGAGGADETCLQRGGRPASPALVMDIHNNNQSEAAGDRPPGAGKRRRQRADAPDARQANVRSGGD